MDLSNTISPLLLSQDMQPTFSFNLRGAYNKIAQLTALQKRNGIVACAAGNFSEAVAYSASRLETDAIIVTPIGTAKTHKVLQLNCSIPTLTSGL